SVRPLLLLVLAAASVVAGCTTGGIPDAGADAGPDDAAADSGSRDASDSCDPDIHLGQACRTTMDCSDGCFCNGVELCMEGVCIAGDVPCDDDFECTADACDEEARSCEFEPDDSAC